MNDKNSRPVFTKKIILQCAARVVLVTVLYAVIIAGGYFIGHNITWRPSSVYYFLQEVEAYSTLWIPLGWLAITLIIIYIYWSRTIGYIDDIMAASMELLRTDDEDIRLPGELREIEYRMNQIKKTALKNEREAREAEQRKNDLVVNLAHDIRTPLASVIGYLSLLFEAPDMPAEQREKYTGITLQKANRLEQLINEFFEITRFNLSSIVLNKGKINLSYMLRQMADEFYPLLSPEGKKAVVQAPDGIVLWGDADKLARVFNNILKNAAAYSYEGSDIVISASDQGESIVIRFENTGDPIPSQKLESIFERFFRLDSARSSQTGGAGLGLAIAREIVAAHGGTIEAESDGDKTVFTVVLPKGESRTGESGEELQKK